MLKLHLGFGGVETVPALALVDTGADRCMFDDRLALSLGINVYEAGMPSTATGIGGEESIVVFPVEIGFPDLDGRSWEIHAQFKRLPDDLNGVLGHAGFLGRMRAEFSFGRELRLCDIRT